jgi:hypothetical protein
MIQRNSASRNWFIAAAFSQAGGEALLSDFLIE